MDPINPINLTRARGYAASAATAISCLLATTTESSAVLTLYTSETTFLAEAGPVALESFETVAARTRSNQPILTPTFEITPSPSLVGVQDALNSPEQAYGAFPSDGSRYLFLYRELEATGTLVFQLAAPATAFGFHVTDIGEATGQVTVRTGVGDTTSDITLANYDTPGLGGNLFFYGFTQTQPFTQVTLTFTGVDEALGLDEVYASTIPEPASWMLMLPLSLAATSRRRLRVLP